MSSGDSVDPVVTSSDGVVVEKSFEPESFPVPAIALDIDCEREESVSVRLIEEVPDHIEPGDVGFHPGYGAAFWTVEEDAIVFERAFDPAESYTTVYALERADAENPWTFLDEPRRVVVDPPVDAERLDESDSSERGKSAKESERDEKSDRSEESDSGETATTTTTSVAASETVPATDRDRDSGSIAAELAAEIRRGDVAQEDVAVLRDALDSSGSQSGLEARVAHLQTELSTLRSYTDALERFLEANGDLPAELRELQSDVESLTERAERAEALAEEATESVEKRIDARTEAVETRLKARLDSRIDERAAVVDDRLETLESEVDSLEAQLAELTAMRRRLSQAVDGQPAGADDD